MNFYDTSFDSGIKIQGGRDGVHLVSTQEGRSSGEAFVEVAESDMADAIKKDKKVGVVSWISILRPFPVGLRP